MRVGEDVDEFARLELHLTCHQMQEERVLGNVERHAEHEIARALVHHQREPRTGDEELEQRVARWERCRIDLAGVPRAHDHAAARRLFADHADHLAQLVDVPPVGRDPIAPLLPVVAPRVPGEPRALAPVVRERVAVPDVHTESVQLVHIRAAGEEPQQLRDDRPECETFRGDRGEAVREIEAHRLAEDRARADTGAVRAIVAFGERFPQDRQVLTHRSVRPRRGDTRGPLRGSSGPRRCRRG